MQAAIHSHRDANIIGPGDLASNLLENQFSFVSVHSNMTGTGMHN